LTTEKKELTKFTMPFNMSSFDGQKKNNNIAYPCFKPKYSLWFQLPNASYLGHRNGLQCNT